MKFRTASRQPAELAEAKKDLDAMFAEAVTGNHGRYNPRGVEVLEKNKMDIAELIVSIIKETVLLTDPLPFLVDEISGDIKNDYAFQELNSALKVVKRSYGSKPLSQRMTWREYGMKTSMKELSVEVPLEEVAGGRTTPSQVAEAIAFAVNRFRITSVLDAIDTAITAIPDRTGKSGYNLRYLSLTQANLDLALDGLYDEALTPTIMGRYIALQPTIRGFTGWSQQTLTEFEQRGVIGMYHGAPVVTLVDQYSKITSAHAIPRTRVYLAGGTKGAKHMTKDVSFLNWAEVDAKSATFGTGIRFEDGTLVFDPYKYRIIETS